MKYEFTPNEIFSLIECCNSQISSWYVLKEKTDNPMDESVLRYWEDLKKKLQNMIIELGIGR
jgi:hypothetical protein